MSRAKLEWRTFNSDFYAETASWNGVTSASQKHVRFYIIFIWSFTFHQNQNRSCALTSNACINELSMTWNLLFSVNSYLTQTNREIGDGWLGIKFGYLSHLSIKADIKNSKGDRAPPLHLQKDQLLDCSASRSREDLKSCIFLHLTPLFRFLVLERALVLQVP